MPESEDKLRERIAELEKEVNSLRFRIRNQNNIKGFIDIIGTVASMELIEAPNISFEDIGGLDAQIEAVREVVELPLTRPEVFKEVGIDPPSGVLLTGPPGMGKTLLAKAIAKATKARFIHLVGSDLVQKFLGEGSRMVREVFFLAKKNTPAIIFIDEIDAIAAKRSNDVLIADREVQRTYMQLLSELDGFAEKTGVVFMAATNRDDVLDSALIRPGRIDRIIRFNLPNAKGRLSIFKIHTRRMKLKHVDLKELANLTEGFNGADIKALCTEAGMTCIRERERAITQEHFEKAFIHFTKEDRKD